MVDPLSHRGTNRLGVVRKQSAFVVPNATAFGIMSQAHDVLARKIRGIMMASNMRMMTITTRTVAVFRATTFVRADVDPCRNKLVAATGRSARRGQRPRAVNPVVARRRPGFEKLKDEKKPSPPAAAAIAGRCRSRTSTTQASRPTYRPTDSNGVAVLVAPGGGHRVLAITHEGYNVGQWLADHGIAAFVLKYRLEKGTTGRTTPTPRKRWPTPGALATIRSRAKEWHVNPNAIGVMGFSAGGEVAATCREEVR